MKGEEALVGRVVAGAMAACPIGKWLVPDAADRVATLCGYARVWVQHCMDVGAVEVSQTADGEVAGAALWLPEQRPVPVDYQSRLESAVGAKRIARFERYDTAARAMSGQQGLRLAAIAVWPNYRRRGHGAELMRRRHTDLDASRVTASAIAISPAARRFCQRHGYRDHGPAVLLPDGPELQPMRRQRASASTPPAGDITDLDT